MAGPPTCPSCGLVLPARAPQGLCPRCLLRDSLGGEALSLTPGGDLGATLDLSGPPGVLETLATSLGAVPRVLLRDTDPGTEPPLHRPASPEMPGPGDRTTHLRLLGEIARGGMGAVLKGRDDDLGRDLAVKVLLEQHRNNPDLVRRFVEEAQIGGQLQHPGIVPIYELGAFADQRPYFAMKLVRGQTLAELLAARATPADGLPRFLGIFEQVAQTMAYAHARGVIHRDLKPSNIMVGSFGEVQVMDWGLAKVLPRGGVVDDAHAGKVPDPETVIATARSGADSDAELSRPGSIMGTPAYMAPEQARGETAAIDERADVFALGSILCEILTGAPAFTGRGSGEIMRLAARGATADALARLAACDAEAELVALGRDCLTSEAADRPRDARAVADRMTAHLAGVQDRLHASERDRAVAEARAVEERRKRRWQLGLAASVAAFLLAGVAGLAGFVAVVRSMNADLSRANTLLAAQRARAESRESQAIDAVKRFRDAVADEPALQHNPGLEPLRKKLLKEPLGFFQTLREQLLADGDTRPEALERLAFAAFELADLTSEIGDREDALRTHREALTIWERLAQERPADTDLQRRLAESQLDIGNLLGKTGRPAEALAAYEAALAIHERLAREHSAVVEFQSGPARCHNNIGVLLRDIGRPAEALAALERARAIYERLVREQPAVVAFQSGLAMCRHNMGMVLDNTGRSAEALAAYEQAGAIHERLVRAHPDDIDLQVNLADHFNNIGTLLSQDRRLTEALTAYTQARTIRERLVREHPTSTDFQNALASIHNNIGQLRSATGEPVEAIAELERSLSIQERLAREHPTVIEYQRHLAMFYNNLGTVLRASGKPAEALAVDERSLEIRRRLTRQQPETAAFASQLGGALNNLALIELDAGRFAQARDRLREAIDWQARALAADPDNPTYRQFLGNHHHNRIVAALGLNDEALAAEARRDLAELAASGPGLKALEPRSVTVLGGPNSQDNTVRLGLGQQAYDAERFASAARLWDAAMTRDPRLGEDLEAAHRYNAACAAAMAGCGQGQDDPKPDDTVRAQLRSQALGWLRADLDARSRAMEAGDPMARAAAIEALGIWQQAPHLAGVRDAAALARLPEAERADWQALWDVVGQRLAGEPKTP